MTTPLLARRAVAAAALALLAACSSSSSSSPAVLRLVAVTPASPSLAQGATQQLTATAKYSDGTTRDVTATATWASLDPVATVSAGLVRAAAYGGGRAVVTAAVGDQVGFTEVAVTGSRLLRVRLLPENVQVPAGVSRGLVALGDYVDGTQRDLTSVAEWDAADAATATAAAGQVTGVGAGETTITARVGEFAGRAPVTVTSATLVSLALAPDNGPIFAPGRTEGFSAFGTFDDGTTYDLTETASWVSSDTSVATASDAQGTRGQVTALDVGLATVTATVGSMTASQDLQVVDDGAFHYVEARAPFSWTDMSDAPTVVSGDDVEVALPALDGFTFHFFDADYAATVIHVSTNGLVSFGDGNGFTGTSYAYGIPSSGTPDGFAAAAWEDLVTSVRVKVVGTAPARELVIEWAGFTYSDGEPIDVQAALSEATGAIEFRYLVVPSLIAPLTGVEDPTGTLGTEHAYASGELSSGLGLRFSP